MEENPNHTNRGISALLNARILTVLRPLKNIRESKKSIEWYVKSRLAWNGFSSLFNNSGNTTEGKKCENDTQTFFLLYFHIKTRNRLVLSA